MRSRDKAWTGVGVLWSAVFSVAMLAGLAGTANAIPTTVCGYDNSEGQPNGVWTDVRRGSDINMVDTLADPCTLNLTGSTGSAGGLWITLRRESDGGPIDTWQCWAMSASILIKRFDNRKAVGFVTNYDVATKTGLFFGVYDNGNTDAITISKFTGGQLQTPPLATKPLGSKIKENTWYDVDLDTCENAVVPGSIDVQFSVDVGGGGDCNDATSCAEYSGPLPDGIVAVGAAGIAGQAKSAFVDSQVRAISMTGTGESEPEPGP
jgi:hypothetical protein